MAGRAKSGSGAETQQLPAPQSGLFSKGKKRAGAGQVRGLQGSSPGCLHACTRKVGSQHSPPAAARGAAAPPRANLSPRSFLSRCLGRLCFFFFFFENCNRNKTSSGCHRNSGQVVFLQSLEHLVRLGPGCRRGAGEGCAPSRRRGLAAGRPRAEYLCYILKNLNK